MNHIKLKVGRYYTTRDGLNLVKVVRIRKDGVAYFEPHIYGEFCCFPDGKVKFNRQPHDGDLIVKSQPLQLEDLI